MNYKIISIADCPELKTAAARWFHDKWDVPVEAYSESMQETITGNHAVPQWHLALDGDMIIGGCGVIKNDFHDRKDLSPNLCALFVELEYRGNGIAGRLLDHACRDMKSKGINTLYLITDHTSFYERYGWHYLCDVNCEGVDLTARMYMREL